MFVFKNILPQKKKIKMLNLEALFMLVNTVIYEQ